MTPASRRHRIRAVLATLLAASLAIFGLAVLPTAANAATLSTVSFSANGGSGIMTPQSEFGPAPLTANTFTRDGYTFVGWNTSADGSGTGYADQATYPFAANQTLYAQWHQCSTGTRTVTFDANGGTGTMPDQVSDQCWPASLNVNAFTRGGYTFVGWNTSADGSGTAYANAATYRFFTDLTVYAQWQQNPSTPVDHTVTFDANGGSGTMSSQTASSPTNLTANTFTMTGYTFFGWSLARAGQPVSYYDQAVYSFDADVTLYALWVPYSPPLKYMVAFDANGGTGTMQYLLVTPGQSVVLPPNGFTRDGYTFTGWAPTGGPVYQPGASYTPTDQVTLYAQWAPVVTGPTLQTVTFDPNGGGGAMVDQTGTVPAALDLNSYYRSGYAFVGWNTAADGTGTAYADGAVYPFAADATLYAQWKAEHTVTFDGNGVTFLLWTQTAAVPTALIGPEAVLWGHTFAGWNTAADGSGTEYAPGAVYSFDADITLYAQWTLAHPSYINVSFDPNGGSGLMLPETLTGAAPLNANVFTRNGYAFTGWNTAADGSGTAFADGAVFPFDDYYVSPITLYAQWTPSTPADSSLVIIDPGQSFTYTGSPITPKVTVSDGTTTLPDTAYTVSYGTNTTVADGGVITVTAGGVELVKHFTITPKPITVTANDQTKVVGTPDPTLTWTAPGLVPGDILTGSLTYFGSAVGSYDIVELTPFANPNYDITFVRGMMTITREAAVNAVISLVSGLSLTIATTSDADQVADATKAYDALSDEQKAQVPQTILADLQQAQQQAGDVNHATTGATASGSALPWNVRLTVTVISTTDARYKAFADTQSGRDVLALYDVSFTDTLTGQAWEPPAGHTVTIALSTVSVSGHTGIVVVHQNSDGTVETVTSTVSGSTVTFDGSSFSLYGVTADVQTSTAEPTPGSTPTTAPTSGHASPTPTTSSTADSGLADTGTDVSAAIAIAVLALLTGAGLLLGIRRRRRA